MTYDSICIDALHNELKIVPTLELFRDGNSLRRFSRDAYNYSPLLCTLLDSCCADLVARPHNLEGVHAVAEACARHQVPLTVRGAGTGNYGQSVPLLGGVILLMGALQAVRYLNPATGVVTVESGCILQDLDEVLRQQGRQLRLSPSTWRTATVGGFVAGGSSGIGSVRWGFLRDPGHLLGLEIVTLEAKSRRLELSASESESLNHAYGTNGIITALTLATAPAEDWQEVAIDCKSWSLMLQLAQCYCNGALSLQLCTLLDSGIVKYLPQRCGSYSGLHRMLLLVTVDALETVNRLALDAGATFLHVGPESSSRASLRELTWNHTTLHMRATDPDWTYLQLLLPQPELAVIEALQYEWGCHMLWHLEAMRQDGKVRFGAIPVVRWRGVDDLERLMTRCRELGILIFNPHVLTVEDGGLGVIDSHQVKAKHRYDPAGLLNPGKLRGWNA